MQVIPIPSEYLASDHVTSRAPPLAARYTRCRPDRGRSCPITSTGPGFRSGCHVQPDATTAFADHVDRSKFGIVTERRLKDVAQHQPFGLELVVSLRKSFHEHCVLSNPARCAGTVSLKS